MSALVRRIRGEDGMALILAVLILAVVSIAASAAITYTTIGQQDAASKKVGTSAYALAQGGLSDAISQLMSHYYDSSGQPTDNTTSLTTMAQTWTPSGNQQSPTSSTACTSTSTCVTWSGVLNCPSGTSCPGGSVITVTGTQKAMWHLTATGKAPNPSGPGLLTRTITIDVPVEADPTPVNAPDIFKAVYSGAQSSTCDLTLGQGVVFTSPVYVKGNFCSNQHSGVEAGPQNLGKLVVGGWASFGQGGHVGTSTTPVASMDIAKSCDGSQSATPCTLTKPGGQNYYTDPGGDIFVSAWSNNPVFPTPPTVDWTARQTERGSWSCTGGQSLTAATFNLTGSAYSCTTATGSLSWDGTTLTINGNVYLDGDLSVSGDFVYSGLGSIFSGGSVSFANNTSVCVGSTSHHDCPSGANWPDIADNFLLILGKNGVSGKNLSIEGGLYSDSTIDFGSGQTNIYGPIVTPTTIDPGQQASSGFPDISKLFSGAPDTPAPYWTLGTPTNGTY
jgi:hypothetical protein